MSSLVAGIEQKPKARVALKRTFGYVWAHGALSSVISNRSFSAPSSWHNMITASVLEETNVKYGLISAVAT
jgi:hypothetical protein